MIFDWLGYVLENFKALFSHHVVFSAGILLFTGYFFGKLANRIGLPSITGYILAGLVLGTSVLGIIHEEMAVNLHSITEIALGMIAITIGSEFDFARLRQRGVNILIMTLCEALGAFLVVFIALSLLGMESKYALLLAAISTATAPAATVIIIRELRARGEFIDYLYGIVAFDDSVCILLFSIVFALVSPLLSSNVELADIGLLAGVLHALGEIFFSCLVGLVAGVGLNFIIRKRYNPNELLIISIAVIFLTTSVAVALNLSLLIANMVLGAVLVNLSFKNRRIFGVIEPVTPPVFALFFILAGTELELSVVKEGMVVLLGFVYLASRFLGKFSGIMLSATFLKVKKEIRKYLGFCLFPQAGVAIGLVLYVQTTPVLQNAPQEIQEVLVMIVNIVLFSIFINELVGPSITRFGITHGTETDM